ncbi:MAG: histidine phosphatase family protein [Steroidobacterales bacterium]
MTRLLLIRHGHVEGIEPESFRGRADIALTALGRRQVQATAHRIATHWRVDAVYTSPLQRCVHTGAAIASACAVSCAALEALSDIDYGVWQGRPVAEVRAAVPELVERWHSAPQLMRFPRGESLQDLVARVAGALIDVLARHGGDTVVLVGHDSVNRALLLQLLDQPLSAYWVLQQQPCGISEVVLDGMQVRVLRVNETAHLDQID